MTPPWANFVTATPEPFSYGIRDDQLVIITGTGGGMAFCRVGLQTGLICQGRRNSEPVSVDPYTLPLARWQSTKLPILDMHPLALAHLLATGQMDRGELLAHASRAFAASGPSVQITLAINVQCNLLRAMRLPRAEIRFATNVTAR